MNFLVKNATIYDGLGSTYAGTDLLVEEGKISAIGTHIQAQDLEILDATDKFLFPGFIASLTPWGGRGPGIMENNLHESSGISTPHMNVKYAFAVDGLTYQELYKQGITSSCLTPDFANLFSGLAAVYKTYGNRDAEMLLREKVLMAGSLSESVLKAHKNISGDMGLFHYFFHALGQASAYDGGAYSPAESALKEVLTGLTPLLLSCNRAQWRLVKQEMQQYPNIRVMLTGFFDVADLDLTNVEGIFLPGFASYGAKDLASINFLALERLVAEGALIAFSPYNEQTWIIHKEAILWNALIACKFGMSPSTAVQMLTSIPARLLGIADRVGSIQVGLDADFSIWSADPFVTFRAKLEHTFIDGTDVAEKERVHVCW